jgi:hypothetical protein
VGVFLCQKFTIIIRMNKFYVGLFIFVVYTISQIFTFYQLQGHLWNKWIKDNPLLMTILGLPIGYVVILASRQMVELWGGQTWPNRIIGFCLGVIVFSLMSWFLLKEPVNLKTSVCLFLSFVILGIQLFWK